MDRHKWNFFITITIFFLMLAAIFFGLFALTKEASAFSLYWNLPEGGGAREGIIVYLYSDHDGEEVINLGPDETSLLLDGRVLPGATYTAQVSTWNSVAESARVPEGGLEFVPPPFVPPVNTTVRDYSPPGQVTGVKVN